ncbi:protein neprosin-like [Nicotiana tabacum]|uniref:Protein neprosin-like n=1 Tax=Nicotiana tabacum TaxID=4097 RepID=A0AC58TXN6_TOBAC
MIWSKADGCPFGTVPIKRITKEDLVRRSNIPPSEDVTYDIELPSLAIVQIQKNPNNKFAGAGMSTSLYNPHVEGQQHSACRLKIQKGSDIIQVGWRVDPTLYRDNKTRLFVHFQAGLFSSFRKKNTNINIANQKDLANGNWLLLARKDYKQIGFWPQKIFTSLASFADNVEWGGVTYSPLGVPKPPMGSSFFPIGSTDYDAYCRRLIILNDKGETFDVDKTIPYVDDHNLYRVSDYPYLVVDPHMSTSPHFTTLL